MSEGAVNPSRASGALRSGPRDVGIVAIGRNEGDRLCRCLDGLPRGIRAAVYVDSASTDDSVAQARRRGLEVVELDMSVPFTAARARNAGLERLSEGHQDLRFVQFIDGDCVLREGFLEAGLAEMDESPRLAMVCGRRRELHPEASIFNQLCDMEWDTPVGDAEACGGDALARLEALRQVGGFDERLIAGEEPELCARLLQQGWRIRRIDREMTWHDAAMTRLGQWWRRAMRSGYGVANVNDLRPGMWRRQRRSTVVWAGLVPVVALVAATSAGWTGLLVLLAYPALWLRIVRRQVDGGRPLRAAALYASSCVVGKLPEALGELKYRWNRRRGRRGRLIEYK